MNPIIKSVCNILLKLFSLTKLVAIQYAIRTFTKVKIIFLNPSEKILAFRKFIPIICLPFDIISGCNEHKDGNKYVYRKDNTVTIIKLLSGKSIVLIAHLSLLVDILLHKTNIQNISIITFNKNIWK
jgi:hypothetical protein